MKTAVVVLAGGEGRRIGGGKPFRLLAGERLIDIALRNARRWSPSIAIATKGPSRFSDLRVPLLQDGSGLEGPVGGLAAGADFAASQGAELMLTLPADTPFLPEDLLVRLLSALAPGTGAALAASGSRLHPVCGLWRIGAIQAALGDARFGSTSLTSLAQHVGFSRVSWPCEPVDPFFNINTEDDLAEAERLLLQKSKISTASSTA